MNISTVKHCVGCMACIERCPQSCINTYEDVLGHRYPTVNTTKCIDCGVCLKVCPAENPPLLHKPQKVIAAWRTDEKLRGQSSSGGMASVLAEEVVANGGTVYGCAFVPQFSFCHIRCTAKEELNNLRGSKYVQSDTERIFHQIHDDLKTGREVLFIGTPCQAAAVRNYFPNHACLFVVDLICHGVPSQRLLRESLPKNFTSLQVSQVEFRTSTAYHFSAKNGISTVYSRPLSKDLYMKGFFTALYYRKSCYSCRYAHTDRVGDLTLGDFWGVNLQELANEENKGISLCMINTESGKNLLKRISKSIKQFERPIAEAVAGNRQLAHPMPRTFRASLFQWLYPRIGFRWGVICAIPEIILKNQFIELLKTSKALRLTLLNNKIKSKSYTLNTSSKNHK